MTAPPPLDDRDADTDASGAVGHRLRVRFGETDQMRIAHHSAYVLWLEAARVEWLRAHGFSYRAWEDDGVSLAVNRVDITYRLPARFDDELEVRCALREARSRRFQFAYRVLRPADDAELATATTVHTPTEPSGRAIRLPERWLAPLQATLADG